MGYRASPLRASDVKESLILLSDFRKEERLPMSAFNEGSLSNAVFRKHRKLAVHVVRDGAKLLGIVTFQRFYEASANVEGIHLCDMFVVKSHRRLGIGHILFDSCVRAARLARRKFVWWMSNSNNLGAMALWRDVGAEGSLAHSFVVRTSK